MTPDGDWREACMASDKNKEMKEVPDWKKSALLYLQDLVHMLLTIVLVFLLLFRIIVVSGDSMYSTLLDGDYLLLLSNLFYHDPEPGDIIVISKESFDNGAPIVKRVIATEGQQVDIDFEAGAVYVDGVELQEDYINNLTHHGRGVEFPLIVEEGCIFVLGDNRGVSLDSRYSEIGQIDKREVLGKALFLMLPGTSHGQQRQDFSRIGAIQ